MASRQNEDRAIPCRHVNQRTPREQCGMLLLVDDTPVLVQRQHLRAQVGLHHEGSAVDPGGQENLLAGVADLLADGLIDDSTDYVRLVAAALVQVAYFAL